ncbi:MAG: hypothetical protein WDZ91_15805 [Paenibacillaceae bacterium]
MKRWITIHTPIHIGMMETLAWVPFIPLAGFPLLNIEALVYIMGLWIAYGLGTVFRFIPVYFRWVFVIGACVFLFFQLHQLHIIAVGIGVFVFFRGSQSDSKLHSNVFFVGFATHLLAFFIYPISPKYVSSVDFLYLTAAINIMLFLVLLQREQLLQAAYHPKLLLKVFIVRTGGYLLVVLLVCTIVISMTWGNLGKKVISPIEGSVHSFIKETMDRMGAPLDFGRGSILMQELEGGDWDQSSNLFRLHIPSFLSYDHWGNIILTCMIGVLLFRFLGKPSWWRKVISLLKLRKAVKSQADLMPYLEEKRSLRSNDKNLSSRIWKTSKLKKKGVDWQEWNRFDLAQKIRRLLQQTVQTYIDRGSSIPSSDTWEDMRDRLLQWCRENDNRPITEHPIFDKSDLMTGYYQARYSNEEINNLQHDELDRLFWNLRKL